MDRKMERSIFTIDRRGRPIGKPAPVDMNVDRHISRLERPRRSTVKVDRSARIRKSPALRRESETVDREGSTAPRGRPNAGYFASCGNEWIKINEAVFTAKCAMMFGHSDLVR
jgi:hypothetical protein